MKFYPSAAVLFSKFFVAAIFLHGCGGGGGGGGGNASQSDPLEPTVEFSAPNPLVAQGTAQVRLLVTNKAQTHINNITANFTFPSGVAIEGGSVGSTCAAVSSGNSTSTGYRITFYSFGAGETCGVFMDIYSTTGSGSKVFTVGSGNVTGDAVPANAQTYSWTWNSP
jgi:hypothetical protein